MQTLRKIILFLIAIVVVLAAALFWAPSFLAYSTNCGKVDTVILLLGRDFSNRQKHAYELAGKGMANYLIIPAHNKIYSIDQGRLRPLPVKKSKNKIYEKNDPSMPWYYEDTHMELIAAKKMMKIYGQKSAIFVSSPYHMRRIEMIVKREFDSLAQYCYSPTPYEPAPLVIWELKASDWRSMWREYIKILWFVIYSPWTK